MYFIFLKLLFSIHLRLPISDGSTVRNKYGNFYGNPDVEIDISKEVKDPSSSCTFLFESPQLTAIIMFTSSASSQKKVAIMGHKLKCYR